jgi:ABC-type transporter MlaC component
MDAYNHGVRSAASTNWITEANMPNYYWSASSQSNNSAVQAWHVSLARSYTALLDKYDASQIVCVR